MTDKKWFNSEVVFIARLKYIENSSMGPKLCGLNSETLPCMLIPSLTDFHDSI